MQKKEVNHNLLTTYDFDLLFLLTKAGKKASHAIQHRIAGDGITHTQADVLYLLYKFKELEPSFISTTLCMEKEVTSRVLKKLVEKNLIGVTPNKIDKRRKEYFIKNKGIKILTSRIYNVEKKLNNQLLEITQDMGLEEEKIKELMVRFINKIID